MRNSDGLAVVHFNNADPSCHFERVEDALHFLTGVDSRCREGCAWLEIAGGRPTEISPAMHPPIYRQQRMVARSLY